MSLPKTPEEREEVRLAVEAIMESQPLPFFPPSLCGGFVEQASEADLEELRERERLVLFGNGRNAPAGILFSAGIVEINYEHSARAADTLREINDRLATVKKQHQPFYREARHVSRRERREASG